MGLVLLLFILIDLASVASPLLVYYLWREWDNFNGTSADDYADRCLYAAIALVFYTVLGRFLFKALLSRRRPGEDAPGEFKTSRKYTVNRPDGTKINVEEAGAADAPPIIFLHGWNANLHNWYYQYKHFKKSHRLIFMDLAGLGKSSRPPNKDFSLEKLASDLQAVIEHTKVKDPILWGHSMGGMTILSFLAKRTSGIKAAILEHTTYTNPVRTAIFSRVLSAIQKPVLVPVCHVMIALSPIIWFTRWISYLNGSSHIINRYLMFAGTQSPAQLDFATKLSTLAPPAVTGRGLLAMFRYDVTDSLKEMNLPVLIVGANRDRLTKRTASEYMHSQIPNSKLVVVSPGNHQSLLERHAEVNKAADEFISAL